MQAKSEGVLGNIPRTRGGEGEGRGGEDEGGIACLSDLNLVIDYVCGKRVWIIRRRTTLIITVTLSSSDRSRYYYYYYYYLRSCSLAGLGVTSKLRSSWAY